jgi:hypothetical protein
VGKTLDPNPDFLTILDPGSGSATLNIILKIFFKVKCKIEEILKMAREVYITEARANLRRQEYWHNISVALGFVPKPLPPAMLKLPILLAAEYQPNLGGASDAERLLVIFQTFFFFFFRIRLFSKI